MYAIVDIAGKQYKAEENKFIYTDRLEGTEGSIVEFTQVLLVSDGANTQVGLPVVSGVKISGKILSQEKADKVIVFKKKRRKGFKKRNGHRAQLTKVLIEKISK